MSIDNRTLKLERIFNAPRQLVWDAWTQPEHIAQWWGRGIEVEIEEHDFRVDGKWKYVMTMPDGSPFISEGVYAEIVAPKKIVSSASFKPMTEDVIFTALFEEEGEQTKLIFSVLHPTEEYKKQQEQMGFFTGWASVFEVLEKYLQSS